VLSVRLTLLTPSGASRDGDGDGMNKVAYNTWAPQSRVGWFSWLGGVAPLHTA